MLPFVRDTLKKRSQIETSFCVFIINIFHEKQSIDYCNTFSKLLAFNLIKFFVRVKIGYFDKPQKHNVSGVEKISLNCELKFVQSGESVVFISKKHCSKHITAMSGIELNNFGFDMFKNQPLQYQNF